ncbi:MAG TPA: hypothetical protein VFQ68_38615 [Streptosporangiaceae bacterium]|nr:hypothetical protein [Streptosporangiaceae bacterium]
MTAAGRWRDENPEELDRLRTTVREWREANPDGHPDEMVAALAGQFRADWEPVLRATLFRTDLRDAHVTTGITIIAGEDRFPGRPRPRSAAACARSQTSSTK